ncbi:transmembrane and coiled-coil domains-containing protein 7 [Clydaea vesicula]|uniref:Transmembrane and coiled-coil domains-containing protein 7 n=1 Tax=Clydaea vesicula TaxID=447962 RepID=A0AAD5XZJ5_9FUNG|nr:transmembrane and coiled-coil domains-containing protein 7 [Clydaea vesicula]
MKIRLPSRNSLENLMFLLKYSKTSQSWTKKSCGENLTKIILRNDGCSSLFITILCSDDTVDELSLQQLQLVCTLLLTVPSRISINSYFTNITEQLFEILSRNVNPATSQAKKLIKAASFIISNIIENYKEFSKIEIIENRILGNFKHFYDIQMETSCIDQLSSNIENLELNEINTLVSSKKLNADLLVLWTLLSNTEPNPNFVFNLLPEKKVFPPLYYIHQTLCSSILKSSTIKNFDNLIPEIFSLSFHLLDKNVSLQILRLITIDIPSSQQSWRSMKLDLNNFGCYFLKKNFQFYEVDVDIFFNLLVKINSIELVSLFFVELFKLYSSNEVEEYEESDGVVEGPDDLKKNLDIVFEINHKKRKLNTAKIILTLLANFGDELISSLDALKIFELAKSILTKQENTHELNSDELADLQQTILLTISLLSAIFTKNDLNFTGSMTVVTGDLFIILETLLLKEKDQEIINAILQLKNLMLQYLNLSEKDSNNSAIDESQMIFVEALQEICHQLIPVRVHGVNKIIELILKKSKIIDERFDSICELFLGLMYDNDSYLYLNAIKGLSALTDKYTQRSLNYIVKKYLENELDLDFRLRVGEVLLKTIQKLGVAFSKYSESLMTPILVVLKDEKLEMRMSSLSLMSCIAETSAYSLFPVIQQVLSYVENSLIFEKDFEIRRGVVGILLFIIRGFDRNITKVLGEKNVKKIFNQLNVVSNNLEEDAITKNFSDEALHNLSSLNVIF